MTSDCPLMLRVCVQSLVVDMSWVGGGQFLSKAMLFIHEDVVGWYMLRDVTQHYVFHHFATDACQRDGPVVKGVTLVARLVDWRHQGVLPFCGHMTMPELKLCWKRKASGSGGTPTPLSMACNSKQIGWWHVTFASKFLLFCMCCKQFKLVISELSITNLNIW